MDPIDFHGKGNKTLIHFSDYIHLCFTEERKSYRFGMMWCWVTDGRFVIFRWTVKVPVTVLLFAGSTVVNPPLLSGAELFFQMQAHVLKLLGQCDEAVLTYNPWPSGSTPLGLQLLFLRASLHALCTKFISVFPQHFFWTVSPQLPFYTFCIKKRIKKYVTTNQTLMSSFYYKMISLAYQYF